uniref:Uncharacterized protein n=1 Tax=Mastacembelus armatus TaxID=205130 RepID=A0A3Q3LZP4_9TELE
MPSQCVDMCLQLLLGVRTRFPSVHERFALKIFVGPQIKNVATRNTQNPLLQPWNFIICVLLFSCCSIFLLSSTVLVINIFLS